MKKELSCTGTELRYTVKVGYRYKIYGNKLYITQKSFNIFNMHGEVVNYEKKDSKAEYKQSNKTLKQIRFPTKSKEEFMLPVKVRQGIFFLVD